MTPRLLLEPRPRTGMGEECCSPSAIGVIEFFSNAHALFPLVTPGANDLLPLQDMGSPSRCRSVLESRVARRRMRQEALCNAFFMQRCAGRGPKTRLLPVESVFWRREERPEEGQLERGWGGRDSRDSRAPRLFGRRLVLPPPRLWSGVDRTSRVLKVRSFRTLHTAWELP